MTRENAPYVNTTPTKEDFVEIKNTLRGNPGAVEAALKLDRIEQELENLRSIIQKRIY